MPDTYLPWFSGYWCAPFGWFADGKLRRAGIHGFAAYHAIRQACYGRGLKPPCEIDEAHVEPAALVRATGAGIGAMTRAFGLLLDAGILERTTTGQIRVLESTPLSPVAKRQEAFRNRAKLQDSRRDSNDTVTLQSRDRNARTETETETETDQDHATHGADATAPPQVKPPKEKKPRPENPAWEAAKRVCLEHFRLCSLPGEPSKSEILVVKRCLDGGMSEADCVAVSTGAIRDPYHTGQVPKWPGVKLAVAQCFGDVGKARALSSKGQGMDHRDNAEAWVLS